MKLKGVSICSCRWPIPLLLAVVLAGAACAPPQPISPGETPRAVTNVQSQQVVRGLASVSQIDVLLLESFPVQVNVVASGDLPDSCTRIDQVRSERQDNAFRVTITTARPADAICTMATVSFQEVVPLDVAGLPAGSYTVAVNGIEAGFELAVDNVLPVDEQEASRDVEGIAAGCPTPNDDTKLIQEENYCFLYPAGYTVDRSGEGQVLLVVGSVVNHSEPQASLEVRDALGLTAEEVADQLLAEVEAAVPGLAVDRDELSLDGEPAVVLDGLPGQDLSRRVLVVHEGQLYDLAFSPVGADAGAVLERTEALYAAVVDSWRFLP